jgi:hypothetical protein
MAIIGVFYLREIGENHVRGRSAATAGTPALLRGEERDYSLRRPIRELAGEPNDAGTCRAGHRAARSATGSCPAERGGAAPAEAWLSPSQASATRGGAGDACNGGATENAAAGRAAGEPVAGAAGRAITSSIGSMHRKAPRGFIAGRVEPRTYYYQRP